MTKKEITIAKLKNDCCNNCSHTDIENTYVYDKTTGKPFMDFIFLCTMDKRKGLSITYNENELQEIVCKHFEKLIKKKKH